MPPHLNITAHLDPSLPVIQRKDEIIATIAQLQVVVLVGETEICKIASSQDDDRYFNDLMLSQSLSAKDWDNEEYNFWNNVLK